MRVQIEELSGGMLRVEIVGSGGSVGGAAAAVRSGEVWRGWKYKRLRRLAGRGAVDLVSKASRLADDAVDIQGG